MINKKVLFTMKNEIKISVDLPNEIVEKIDSIAKKTGRTRSDIVRKILQFGTNNFEIIS